MIVVTMVLIPGFNIPGYYQLNTKQFVKQLPFESGVQASTESIGS